MESSPYHCFSWKKQEEAAEKNKIRRDKQKAKNNPDFVAKSGASKVRKLLN